MLILLSNIIVILYLTLNPMSNVNITMFITMFYINSNKYFC